MTIKDLQTTWEKDFKQPRKRFSNHTEKDFQTTWKRFSNYLETDFQTTWKQIFKPTGKRFSSLLEKDFQTTYKKIFKPPRNRFPNHLEKIFKLPGNRFSNYLETTRSLTPELSLVYNYTNAKGWSTEKLLSNTISQSHNEEHIRTGVVSEHAYILLAKTLLDKNGITYVPKTWFCAVLNPA